MQDEARNSLHTWDQLQTEVVICFGNLYYARVDIEIDTQLKTINSYPTFFSLLDLEDIYKLVSKEEVGLVLKIFSKNKSPCLDSWIVEIFIHFFELMGEDLV